MAGWGLRPELLECLKYLLGREVLEGTGEGTFELVDTLDTLTTFGFGFDFTFSMDIFRFCAPDGFLRSLTLEVSVELGSLGAC